MSPVPGRGFYAYGGGISTSVAAVCACSRRKAVPFDSVCQRFRGGADGVGPPAVGARKLWRSDNLRLRVLSTLPRDQEVGVLGRDDYQQGKAVEEIYQKKTQREHILLRPDTYIGSTNMLTDRIWVHDEGCGMIRRQCSYVPGLYKIFDEILVNAADNAQRDSNMDTIKVDIDAVTNLITVMNNGKTVPVEMHAVDKVYVPELIFGHLLTGSNFNDSEMKVTGGRNGYG
jgi:hypothetical protein